MECKTLAGSSWCLPNQKAAPWSSSNRRELRACSNLKPLKPRSSEYQHVQIARPIAPDASLTAAWTSTIAGTANSKPSKATTYLQPAVFIRSFPLSIDFTCLYNLLYRSDPLPCQVTRCHMQSLSPWKKATDESCGPQKQHSDAFNGNSFEPKMQTKQAVQLGLSYGKNHQSDALRIRVWRQARPKQFELRLDWLDVSKMTIFNTNAQPSMNVFFIQYAICHMQSWIGIAEIGKWRKIPNQWEKAALRKPHSHLAKLKLCVKIARKPGPSDRPNNLSPNNRKCAKSN